MKVTDEELHTRRIKYAPKVAEALLELAAAAEALVVSMAEAPGAGVYFSEPKLRDAYEKAEVRLRYYQNNLQDLLPSAPYPGANLGLEVSGE